MSTEIPYPNRNNEQIWKELDDYFSNFRMDSTELNIRLARPSVERWGAAFEIGAFSWLAESIEKQSQEFAKMARFGMPDRIINMRLVGQARSNFIRLRDLVSLSGPKAGVSLVGNIGVTPNEDEKALSAYMLAQEFIPTLDSMNLDVSKIFLKNLYRTIAGTGCRMSVAWALHEMGDRKEWESIVYSDQFFKREHIDMLEEFFKEARIDLGGQKAKTVLCREYAVPGSTGLVPEYAIGDTGIFEMLVLDIASDGKAFIHYPSWQRKPRSIDINRG